MKTGFGLRLKKYYTEKGLKGKDFAESINKTGSMLSQYVNETTNPDLKTISKIKDVYEDLNLNWLVSGKGQMFDLEEQTNNYEELSPTMKTFINKVNTEMETMSKNYSKLQEEMESLKKKIIILRDKNKEE